MTNQNEIGISYCSLILFSDNFMQNDQHTAPFMTSYDFLQLIAKACQSYREKSSKEGFVSFLRDHIFCHLGPFFIEIYFRDDCQNTFIPCPSGPHPVPQKHTACVPTQIPADDPLLADLLVHHIPTLFHNERDADSFLASTGNLTQIILPIIPEDQTTALLYIGCRENLTFPDDYLQGIQTITTIIGSWLRSKDVLSQIENAMASLEYSEQLQQAMYEISEQAHVTSTTRDLFLSLHEIVGRFINARNFLIALREERDGDQYLKFAYFSDELDSHLEGMEFKIDPKREHSMTSFLIQKGKPVLLGPGDFDQFCQENNIKYFGSKSYSLIAAPFYLDHLAGVVVVQSYREFIYTEKDKDLLAYVARHISDALARKKTIDDIRNTNEIFSLFMRYSPVYILFKDVTESQNRVLQASRNYKKITGKSDSEMIGLTMHQLFPDDFAAKVIADDWQVVSSGIPTQLEQHLHGRIYHSIKFPITQENRTLVAAFSVDITEQKQMEEALHESDRRYLIIFDKSPFGVVCFNPKGEVFDFNDKFIELMGSTRKKLLGFNAVRQSSPIVQKNLKKALAGEITSCEESYTSVTGDKARYLRGIFCPVVPGQSPTEVIATIEDITEQKEYENEQHKIEKLESLGVLAGGIAHDFNNILTGIMANISFAQIFLDAGHKSKHILAEAENASRRAAELAQQLLTFAKGGEPQKKVISIESLIREAVSLMFRGSNVKADVAIDSKIHAMEADAGQISQVLNNIIINGNQAMPDGGTFHIIAENEFLPEDNSYGLTPGNYIKVSLKDEGYGIAPKDRQRIFDPYFTTKMDGTGLGLASAYSIITRHKGHIAVDSNVGEGTVFTIYLPSIGTSLPEHLVVAPKKNHPHQGGTILVMDDEEMIRDIAEAMLTHLGYTVTTCSRGEEAIELYRKSLEAETPFGVVIVDLTIPGGLGGEDVARHIRTISPTACLIVSSGYSNDPVMANHQEYGFCASIAKPYNIGEVEQTLNSLPEH